LAAFVESSGPRLLTACTVGQLQRQGPARNDRPRIAVRIVSGLQHDLTPHIRGHRIAGTGRAAARRLIPVDGTRQLVAGIIPTPEFASWRTVLVPSVDDCKGPHAVGAISVRHDRGRGRSN